MGVSLSMYAGAGAQFFDNNGNPLAGGLIYTYSAGTTTPIATYTSSTGGTANTNPIVLDSAGRTPAQIWLTEGNSYKFVLQTSLGATIKTDDNIFASYALAKQVGVAVGLGANSVATNIAAGDTALDSNTSGSNNTAVGYNAMTANTDGFQNTAVGSEALDANTSGDYNTAVGYQALTAATTANYNTGIGYRALNANTVGALNTAIGADSLVNCVAGNQNVAIGREAAKGSASSTGNVAVGVLTLMEATADYNTAIGHQAGGNLVSGSNNTYIGYGSRSSAPNVSNEITLGNESITSMRVPGLTLTFRAKYFNNGTLTVATLPAAATAGAGARAFVTDANATTFASVVAGGGANGVPVYSDGTNWRIG